VHCVPFRTLTLLVGWQEEHLVHKNMFHKSPESSRKKVDEENWSENWLSMFTWKKTAIKVK